MEVSKKVTFIKDWIFNYVNLMPKKAQSLVIGISGGIDSSVTSTLCAMTGIKTIVLSMPNKQIASQHDLCLKQNKIRRYSMVKLIIGCALIVVFQIANQIDTACTAELAC